MESFKPQKDAQTSALNFMGQITFTSTGFF